jgi:hypothetical protein
MYSLYSSSHSLSEASSTSTDNDDSTGVAVVAAVAIGGLNLLIMDGFFVLMRVFKTRCLLPFLHLAVGNGDFEFATGGGDGGGDSGGDGGGDGDDGLNLLIMDGFFVLTRVVFKTRRCLLAFLHSAVGNQDFEFAPGGGDGGDGGDGDDGLNLLIMDGFSVLTRGFKTRWCLLAFLHSALGN